MTDEQILTAINTMAEKLATNRQPSWYEHVDLMQVTLVGAVGAMAWSLKGWIQNVTDQMTNSITVLFKKHDRLREEHEDLRSEVDTLRGAHDERVCLKIYKEKTPDTN